MAVDTVARALAIKASKAAGLDPATIATEYDSSKTYYIGDLVMHDNKLYICASQTSGPWDASKWEETNIADTIEEKRVNLYKLI